MTIEAVTSGRDRAQRFPRFVVLDTPVHAMTSRDILDVIGHAIASGDEITVANHNLHSIYLLHQEPRMRAFYARARYTFIDGMPLVLLGRTTERVPLRREHRTTWIDFIGPFVKEAAQRQWRVFFLGGAPGVAARAADILRRHAPGLELETEHGYFDPEPGSPANEAVLARIRTYGPHVLIVGMGMPRQEVWILENEERLECNVLLSAGAIMDYVAGAIPTPPRWMGQVGLEWLYRLASEPQRLWRRYLVEPWYLLGVLYRSRFRPGSRQPSL